MSSSLLLTLTGFSDNLSLDGRLAEEYNNDTGLWSSIAGCNMANTITGLGNYKQAGGWDGNRWYVISVTGGLHAYTPATNSWAGPLVSGTVVIGQTNPQSSNWCMASDGAYVYILSERNDFRRYDPGSDTLTALAVPPGSTYGIGMFLCSDGSGSIYGYKGAGTPVVARYDILSNVWVSLPAGGVTTSGLVSSVAAWASFLQGFLWVLADVNAASVTVYRYSPASGTWQTMSGVFNHSQFSLGAYVPVEEDTDSTIRLWQRNDTGASQIYNINTDSWVAGQTSPYNWVQGTNFVVTRAFSAAFTWYLPDGITLVPTTIDLGTAVLSQELTYHARVQTPVGRAAGVTVSVPVNTGTDAEDPVRICQTLNGTYATSFSTGALNPGDAFDVYLKFAPTAQQTLGLAKRFVLQITSN